jgi:hypothetical protein
MSASLKPSWLNASERKRPPSTGTMKAPYWRATDPGVGRLARNGDRCEGRYTVLDAIAVPSLGRVMLVVHVWVPATAPKPLVAAPTLAADVAEERRNWTGETLP